MSANGVGLPQVFEREPLLLDAYPQDLAEFLHAQWGEPGLTAERYRWLALDGPMRSQRLPCYRACYPCVIKLVTFNVRDYLPAANQFDLTVLRPGEFLRRL